jgi:hypothetical protein
MIGRSKRNDKVHDMTQNAMLSSKEKRYQQILLSIKLTKHQKITCYLHLKIHLQKPEGSNITTGSVIKLSSQLSGSMCGTSLQLNDDTLIASK